MQTVIQYLFLFIFGAVAGWIIEVFYRLIKHGLINPGFLNGPYLPIYGFGVMAMRLLCGIDFGGGAVGIIIYGVTVTVTLTLFELIAGLIFIGQMKIKLWDYSKRFLNIKGIICPLFSLIWGMLGMAYYFLFDPLLLEMSILASESPVVILFTGAIYGVFAVDVFNSLSLGGKIKKVAAELKIIINFEKLKLIFRHMSMEENRKSGFFNPFKWAAFSTKFKEAVIESKIYKFVKMKRVGIDSKNEDKEKE